MEVQGAEQMRVIVKRLKEAGDKGLQREFNRGIAKAMKPLRTTDLPASAIATLPKKNGINDLIAATRYRISKSTAVRRYGLRLVAKDRHDIYSINKGFLRHPVFKRKGEESRNTVWVTQRVTPGWFDKPCNAAAPQIRNDVSEGMIHVIKQIDGKEAPGAEPIV